MARGGGLRPANDAVAPPARVDDDAGECSNAGGTHAYFSLVDSWSSRPFKVAELGAHSLWLDRTAFTPGELFVAGVSTHAPMPTQAKGAGWCLDQTPDHDATVGALVPVATEAEGFRLLERLARRR